MGNVPAASLEIRDAVEPGPPVTDPSVRRATLAEANDTIGTRPLVPGQQPGPRRPTDADDAAYRLRVDRLTRRTPPDRIGMNGYTQVP